MHDRELKLSEIFRDFLRLFETFRSQKAHEFNGVLYGKDEVLHGKDKLPHGKYEVLYGKDEVLWPRQVLHGMDEVFEQRSQQQFSNL